MKVEEHLMNEVLDQIEAVANNPEMIRNTANYQTMLRMREKLVQGGITIETAEIIVSEMKIDLDGTFHTDYPETFTRIINVFSTALINIYHETKKDFRDPELALRIFAKQCSLTFN